jgi:hypothetical protein
MFNRLRNSSRVILFIRKFAQFFYFIQDALILNFARLKKIGNLSSPTKIVTAADTSHFESALQLITSIQKESPVNEIIFYDLGLKYDEILELKKYNVTYKKFEFENYPKFVNLSEQDAGAYAWKPQIISYESKTFKGVLIWMDAGDLVITSLEKLKILIKHIGFYSPLSNGYVKQWTHISTLEALEIDKNIFKKRMLNAAIIGLDTENGKYVSFIEKWSNLSLQKALILPKGAGKNNHRWDQSLLTITYYQKFQKFFFPRTHKYFGILTHQDID